MRIKKKNKKKPLQLEYENKDNFYFLRIQDAMYNNINFYFIYA